MEHYKYFQNRECEYFPCHSGLSEDQFSCLFCYCPLYALGDRCGGNFVYLDSGIKDCSRCLRPHRRDCYDKIMEHMADVMELAKKPSEKP